MRKPAESSAKKSWQPGGKWRISAEKGTRRQPGREKNFTRQTGLSSRGAQFFVSLPAWKAKTAPSLMPSGQRVVMVLSRVLKRMPSMPCM